MDAFLYLSMEKNPYCWGWKIINRNRNRMAGGSSAVQRNWGDGDTPSFEKPPVKLVRLRLGAILRSYEGTTGNLFTG